MIDTLGLTLTDYEMDADADLTLKHPTTNFRTGASGAVYPLWVSNGCVVEAQSAHHNADNFNVDVQPISPNDPTMIGCLVKFSAPKVLTGENFRLADGKDTAKASRRMEKLLREIGIRTNIKTANICRLDAAKNLQLAEPCQNYFPVLGMLDGKRMTKRDYGTTHLWGNKSHQICAYDKIMEMQSKKHTTTGLPSNSLRIEWRLLKSAKFKDVTGMKTLKDVIENYDHIENCYRNNMEKQLFSLTVPDFNRLSSPQSKDEFMVFAELGISCWWGACMRAKGFQCVPASDFDVLLSAALEIAKYRNDVLLKRPVNSASYRKEISRIRRDFHEWRADSLSLPIASAQRTTAELYTELKTKTLSA